jgi:hypothetical protein
MKFSGSGYCHGRRAAGLEPDRASKVNPYDFPYSVAPPSRFFLDTIRDKLSQTQAPGSPAKGRRFRTALVRHARPTWRASGSPSAHGHIIGAQQSGVDIVSTRFVYRFRPSATADEELAIFLEQPEHERRGREFCLSGCAEA